MEAISRHEGTSARELTELLDIRPSSLSEMPFPLGISGGYPAARDEKDARISHIWLTERGAPSIPAAQPDTAALQDALLQCLTPQETKELNPDLWEID